MTISLESSTGCKVSSRLITVQSFVAVVQFCDVKIFQNVAHVDISPPLIITAHRHPPVLVLCRSPVASVDRHEFLPRYDRFPLEMSKVA